MGMSFPAGTSGLGGKIEMIGPFGNRNPIVLARYIRPGLSFQERIGWRHGLLGQHPYDGRRSSQKDNGKPLGK